jgi:hypothetical protein
VNTLRKMEEAVPTDPNAVVEVDGGNYVHPDP